MNTICAHAWQIIIIVHVQGSIAPWPSSQVSSNSLIQYHLPVIFSELLTRLAAGAVADLVSPWGRVNDRRLRHVCLSEIAVLGMMRRRKRYVRPVGIC